MKLHIPFSVKLSRMHTSISKSELKELPNIILLSSPFKDHITGIVCTAIWLKSLHGHLVNTAGLSTYIMYIYIYIYVWMYLRHIIPLMTFM